DAAIALRLRSATERLDVSRGELRRRVRQLAAALGRLGIQEEQRVLVALPDGPEYVYAFLGAIWAGAVPVLVSTFLRPADYLPFVRETRARAVITTEAVAEVLEPEMRLGRLAPALLTVAPGRSGSLWREIEDEPPSTEPFAAHPDDPAFWLYSSGTSGRPKGVIHVQRSILHAVESYGRHVLAVRADDVAYATSKLFFAYGLGASLYFPLAAGASVLLSPEPFAPARTWQILTEERPSLLFAVPAVYRALLDHAPARAEEAVAGLRRLVSAGEALPEAIFAEWKRRFGQEILDGLGSTEALHVFLSNRPDDCTPGTLGRPVPGYEVQVMDENGAPVVTGEAGQLRVRGGSIAAGYWQRAEATRRAFRGEWLLTGDQALEQADGTFRLLGRTDDLLKVSGQWVSPLDVEGVVAAVAGVRECAVVGCAGESGLMEVVACVVSLPGEEEAVGQRIEHACAERLPRFKRPKRVVFLASLPRTATGKVQRFVLREHAGVAQR
ncbi:MAG TPA: benzoate-CoA ligase family protein, partial [Verrucomicrobiae bacterium]|nr:benzoate-CoA ligase family protein [Verrucomicrobiae bacterium]